MKLTIATTILASSISTTIGSLRNHADESVSTTRRDLSVSSITKQSESDVTASLKERRASKKENGKIITHLKNKLEQKRNLVEQTTEMDIGALSRDLQGVEIGGNLTDVISDVVEPSTVIGDLYDLCTSNTTDPEFSCTCTNLDVEAYTATVSCAYAEKCLEPTENSCNENKTFCFVETYNLEVSSPGTGSSSICYDVKTPSTFSYCYGLTYTSDSEAPDGCFLEIDGTKCNMCDFSVSAINPNITCNDFDCNNVDTVIADGQICGDDTIVSKKIESYLTYAALPCPGGCNICPLGGDMSNLDANVTMITGDSYYCYQLNLAAQLGYLENIPGDLCNSLPTIVNEPCGCTGMVEPGTQTESPVDTSVGTPAAPAPVTDVEVVVTDAPVTDAVPESAPSGATSNGNFFLTVAAAVVTTFGWMMI